MDARAIDAGPTTEAGGGPPGWVHPARDLHLVAMAVFVVNIVIGC